MYAYTITEQGETLEERQFATIEDLVEYLKKEFDRIFGWIEEDEVFLKAETDLMDIETEDDLEEFVVDMSYWRLETCKVK